MPETTHSEIMCSRLEEPRAGSALRALERAYDLEDRSAIAAFIKCGWRQRAVFRHVCAPQGA
jgi:hypothetical protein